jgi:hypothetical protein
VVDIKALPFIFIKSKSIFYLVLFSELILSIIYGNPHGNDLILTPYNTVLILCTCELKLMNYYLLI